MCILDHISFPTIFVSALASSLMMGLPPYSSRFTCSLFDTQPTHITGASHSSCVRMFFKLVLL